MKKILKKVASKYVDSLSKALSVGDEKDGVIRRFFKKATNPLLERERSMVINRLPGYFLIFCIVGTFYLLFVIVQPFFTTIVVSSLLTILFYGVFKKIRSVVKFGKLASVLTCLLVILVIILPFTAFLVLLVKEGVGMYATISAKISSGALDFLFNWNEGGWFYDLKMKLMPIINLDTIDFKSMIVETARNISTYIVAIGGAVAANIGSIMLGFVIMLFSMFYLFKDGESLVERLTLLSPLPRRYENEIIKKLKQTVRAIAFGVFLTAIIQGFVAGIGYTIAGVPNPVFWATATALFSLLPLIGTASIWFPAAIIMLALGNYAGGIFLLFWGVFAVGTVDNLVTPYLIGSKTQTYPLLTFFVVLGGVWTFGLQGLIFGPIVMILFLTLLHIYELEYKHVLES